MSWDPWGEYSGSPGTYGKSQFYFNGSLLGSNTVSTLPTAPVASDPFVFGGTSTFADLMSASLDGWGVWNTVLTAAQISQLYNSGSGIDVI